MAGSNQRNFHQRRRRQHLMEIRQDSGASCCGGDVSPSTTTTSSSSSFSNRPQRNFERPKSEERESIRCYELFCVHQQSLLHRRDQVLVEAERLAKRLSSPSGLLQ